MTESELLTTLKSKIQGAVWTGSSTKVFNTNSVVISVGPEENALSNMIVPIAIIRPLNSTADPTHGEEPDLLVFNVGVSVITAVPGDSVGENVLMGANKTAGSTDSRGRGIFEIEKELLKTIKSLTTADGIVIQFRTKSAIKATMSEYAGYIAWRDYTFEAICSSSVS